MNATWKHRTLCTVVAAAGALASFGCGGDDDSTTAQPPASITKAQFLEKGNQICRDRLEEKDAAVKAGLKALPPEELSKPSTESLEAIGGDLLPPIERLAAEFRELPAPDKDDAAVAGVIRKLEAGLARAQSDPGMLARANPFEEAADAARAYGLKACIL